MYVTLVTEHYTVLKKTFLTSQLQGAQGMEDLSYCRDVKQHVSVLEDGKANTVKEYLQMAEVTLIWRP